MAESANPAPGATRSPIGSQGKDLARLETETDGAVRARELVDLAQVSLRCDPSFTDRLPFPVPREPNTTTADALWLGPDEWLVVGAAGTQAGIADELATALAGADVSIVDVSANRAVLDLSGPGALDVLATGCPLDLHPRSWRPGMCAQTLFDRTPVLLEHLPGGGTRLYVRPSFADDLVDRLVDRRAVAGGSPVP